VEQPGVEEPDAEDSDPVDTMPPDEGPIFWVDTPATASLGILGNLRDGQRPIGVMPVGSARTERAALVEGPLVWAWDGGEQEIDAADGRRVVLFALTSAGTPARVASVTFDGEADGLTVLHCGPEIFLWHAQGEDRVLRRGTEVIATFSPGAGASPPVCSGTSPGLRLDGEVQVNGEPVAGPAWWWPDATLPIAQDALPISEMPDGWLIVDATGAARIDRATAALVPNLAPWPEGAQPVAAASDAVGWAVVIDVPGQVGGVAGGRMVWQVDRQRTPASAPLTSNPGTLRMADDGGAVWRDDTTGEGVSLHDGAAFAVVPEGFVMGSGGALLSVLARDGTFQVADARQGGVSGALELDPAEAEAERWTGVSVGLGWLDLPPGTSVDGRSAPDSAVGSLAMVTFGFGSTNCSD